MLKKKYWRFGILVFLIIVLIILLGLDEDRTIINGIRHFLKGLFKAL